MEMSDIGISQFVFDAAHVIFGTRPILFIVPFANEPEQSPGLIKFTHSFQGGGVIVDRDAARVGPFRFEVSDVLESFEDTMQQIVAAYMNEKFGCARGKDAGAGLFQQCDLVHSGGCIHGLVFVPHQRIHVAELRHEIGELRM